LDLDEIAYDGGAVLDLAGFGDVVPEGLHVPGGGGAAFGAEAAVEADVFVLDHDAAGLEAVGDVDVLRNIQGGYFCAAAKVGFLTIRDKADAACRADVHARVAFYAFRRRENRLHVAIQTAFRFLKSRQRIEPQLHLLLAVDQGLCLRRLRHGEPVVFVDLAVVCPLVNAHLHRMQVHVRCGPI
jgi:hypothetical protein